VVTFDLVIQNEKNCDIPETENVLPFQQVAAYILPLH
jgi:hypothetical protein